MFLNRDFDEKALFLQINFSIKLAALTMDLACKETLGGKFSCHIYILQAVAKQRNQNV